ncbi:MAG: ATPase, P-type (transporting), superfamily, subfamily, partial [Proteobacteria bacterium]|nr:ATPase, P-type (transporting), superfamily, subfamily [Pseudomonadota bacterium]
MTQWHQLETAAVLEQLATDASIGLTDAEARARLQRFGPNDLQATKPPSPWRILGEQAKNVLVIILLIAVGLSAFLGHTIEAIAIAVIVLFAVLLGFVQEYRAERAIEALRKMAAPVAAVVRDHEEQSIPAHALVPGDIILLRAGDKIPADARLIEAINLQIDEASLTGESVPIDKQTSALAAGELALGDRKNIAYAGTAVTYGRGRAAVVATAMDTEFGKIARMLQTVETGKTPLQQNLDKVGRALAQAAVVVVAVVVALAVFRGQPLLEMFIFAIALAVAVVPEALPAVVTISLAIGVQRMVKRNALIRRLPAVETLGSVSVICSDKTGTLTKDEMTCRRIFVAGQLLELSGSGYQPVGVFARNGNAIDPSPALITLLRAAALASDAYLVEVRENQNLDGSPVSNWQIKGDPTEGALVVAAAKAGLHKAELDAQFPRVHEIPFTSESKRMTTLHSTSAGNVAYAKGAPEVILDFCTQVLSDSGAVALDSARREGLIRTAREMASDALRVLAIAYKSAATPENAESEMVFLGLVGMIDPPRPEAKAAIDQCQQAGIKPVMITGDHPLTAQAIARELGLLKAGRVITGSELETMSEPDFDREVENIEVYARVSPAHKLRVVTALQNRGHIVAMTGDGVNDAPALKKADIGVAMGITGTDVTKEAAAMTLTDDNFASIVAAVDEGRAVFENIKKYLMFLLSCNFGEIVLLVGATFLAWPLPLTAVQILYINLATDGLPALALAVDPHEQDLMRRPPRDPRRGIFTRPVVTLMIAGGLWSGIVNLSFFRWALDSGRTLEEAMSMVFVSLVLIEFLKAYNFRSDRQSLFHRPFANKWLNLAIAWEMLLLILVVYLPFFQSAVGTFNLPLEDWLIGASVALTICPVLETVKLLVRRGWLG